MQNYFQSNPAEETNQEIAWTRIEQRLLAALRGQPEVEADRELASILRFQSKKSYVRELLSAIAYCKTSHPITLGLEGILVPLTLTNDKNWRQQFLSAWILHQAPLPPKCAERTCSVLCSTLNRYNRIRHLVRGSCILRAVRRTASVCIPMGMLAAIVFPSPGDHLVTGILTGLFVGAMFTLPMLFIGGPISLSLDLGHRNSVRIELAHALGAHPDVCSTYELVMTSLDSDSTISRAALRALARVLPALEAKHYGQMPAQTVPKLCRVLDNVSSEIPSPAGGVVNPFAKWKLMLLDALAVIGDARALKTVSKQATHGSNDAVRTRAAEVVAILEERDRQEIAAKTLLRGSAMPPSCPDQLLRPATSVVFDTDGMQLVRPSESRLDQIEG